MTFKKPLILSDLDDTFFQTARKMNETGRTPERMAALDRELKPRSFMTKEQVNLVDWLLATSEVIPITARGSEEFSRVDITFSSYKVVCHGAVILNPDNQPNIAWQTIIQEQMNIVMPEVLALETKVNDIIATYKRQDGSQLDAWSRINEENGSPIYLVCKVRDSLKEAELAELAELVESSVNLDNFYIHRNRNNLAFLPKVISKENATQFLLDNLIDREGRAVLSFGDSLSDLPFMAFADFICVPQHSQISADNGLYSRENHGC